MKQLVGIKGNPYGITLRLDSEASFEEILVELDEKLKSSARFFRNANLALKVEKRSVTEEEEEMLIDHIEQIAGVKVACIMDESKETTEYYQSMLEEAERIKQEMLNLEEQESTEEEELGEAQGQVWEQSMQKEGTQGQFYKGTLRSGQVVESGSSIIVLGDVNPGAKVVANGNIVVLGSLKGYAFAGAAGNDTAFVVALEMKPMQIRIGQYFGVDAGKKEKKLAKKGLKRPKIQPASEPKIAFVSEESICIESLSRDIMGDIHYQ